MILNERNYAGDHVVVGSLEVLGDISGGNIKEIRRNVNLIQQQAEAINRTQNKYWEELSSDSVITPLEKQQLLKEIKSIQNSYTAIYTQALSLGLEASEYVQDYIAAYDDLYNYIYSTLHLFDDMETSTDIENRTTFNNKFYSYYYDESFVLVALSKGILDSIEIRVLTSLLDEGEEGDVGIYHGALYQYVNGEWKNVNTGNYKGALNAVPNAEQDAFFLASDNFIAVQELWVNGEQLQIDDGNGLDTLGIGRLFRKGYIYYCQDGGWFEEEDKTNYKYVAAFADVLNVTGELPQIFQDALDDLQEQIDNNRVPKYRGPSAENPADPVEGDYFVYSGTTTATRRRSDIYQYQSGAWVHLDPVLSQNSTYYMQALEDILLLNNADDGYFAALFAQALFANNAFLYALSTKILTLRGPGGYIQSENWSAEELGFRLDYDGNIDANGNTHIGGSCVIDGNTVIGNDATVEANVTGDLNIAGIAHLYGQTIIEGNAKFTGDIDSGPLFLSSDNPGGQTFNYAAGQEIPNREFVGGSGTYGTISFDKYEKDKIIEGSIVRYWVMRLYRKTGNTYTLIYEKVHDYLNHGPMLLEYNFSYTMILPSGTKTFKLINLPTQAPGIPNCVWRSGDTLKIT